MRRQFTPQSQRKQRFKREASWMMEVWAARGQTPPPEYLEQVDDDEEASEPELDDLEAAYMRLFNLAQTCRPYGVQPAGMSAVSYPLPLPYTAILDIAMAEGFDMGEWPIVLHVLRGLDQVVLEMQASR